MSGPNILCLAGFGDNASLFAPLLTTPLAEAANLLPLNLPGFGAPALKGPTSLEALAHWVDRQARAHGATLLLAHSVASITATLAAEIAGSPINTILSLEGNLTAQDAYFSGKAADFDTATDFTHIFIPKLEAKAIATQDTILARYVAEVKKADAQALWELGCDARHFSDSQHPGERLKAACGAQYFYNPDNCPPASLEWLAASDMSAHVIKDASHWPTLDAAKELASLVQMTLGQRQKQKVT